MANLQYYRPKQINTTHYYDQRLSAHNSQSRLKTDQKEKTSEQENINDLRMKLKVYQKGGESFIDSSAAYALKITNVRAVMTENPRLYKIDPAIINYLKNNKPIDVEYINLENDKSKDNHDDKSDNNPDVNGDGNAPIEQENIDAKRILKVYEKSDKTYIDHSAAYALGLVDVRSIMLDKPHLFEIQKEQLNKILNDKTIEAVYMNLEEIDKQEKKVETEVETNKMPSNDSNAKKISRSELFKSLLKQMIDKEMTKSDIEDTSHSLKADKSQNKDNEI